METLGITLLPFFVRQRPHFDRLPDPADFPDLKFGRFGSFF
jgi:hypothetical protein